VSAVSNPGSKTSIAGVAAATGASIVGVHAGPADPASAGVNGSGVVIGQQQVLTSASALGGFTHVTVNARGHVLAASLVGTDPLTNLALLRLTDGRLEPAPLGSADSLGPGSVVIGVGQVGDQRWYSVGLVDDSNQLLTTTQGTLITGLVSTDLEPVPGTDGGALLARNGAVVGILLSTMPGSAMPIDWARDVATQLDASGKAHHGWLGASAVTASERNEGGARIVALTFGPAANAGLVRGDVVTAIGTDKITSVADLLTAVLQRRPGDPVTLNVRRGFLQLRLSVTLSERFAAPPANTPTGVPC
jgi:putative serine protease PepD